VATRLLLGKIACSVGRLGRGLDVRGEGGYFVAPPSVTDAPYRWVTDYEPARLPDALADLMVADSFPRNPEPGTYKPQPTDATTEYGRATCDKKCEIVRNAPVGERRDKLNGAAYSLGQLVGEVDPEFARAELERAALAMPEPLSQYEIRVTIDGALRDGALKPYARRPLNV
jgi:Bifunctional DNA primase/polymerase, N-terminal